MLQQQDSKRRRKFEIEFKFNWDHGDHKHFFILRKEFKTEILKGSEEYLLILPNKDQYNEDNTSNTHPNNWSRNSRQQTNETSHDQSVSTYSTIKINKDSNKALDILEGMFHITSYITQCITNACVAKGV